MLNGSIPNRGAMKYHPDYKGPPLEYTYRMGNPVTISTGRKIPVRACDKCGRADWKDEELTVEEAVERGILVDESFEET